MPKTWMSQIYWPILSFIMLCAVFQVPEVRGDEGDSLTWLNPDQKIYVLQNRKYIKAGHAVLTAMGGVGVSNPYRTTFNLDPRFAYYATENWGVELFYTWTSNTPNSTFQALSVAAPTTLPSIREIRAQYGGEIHYVPFYAKVNVYDAILYLDWYFGAGAGSVQSYVNTQTLAGGTPNYVQDNLFAVFLSTGHQYHLSQAWSARIDVTSAIYQAHINGLTGDTAWYSNINISAGISWRL